MPNFRIVNDANQIPLDCRWSDAPKFNSKNRIVSESGAEIDIVSHSNRYKIIAKKERLFSRIERIGRALLGILAIGSSLGFALLAKRVRQLFTKGKCSARFAKALEKQTECYRASDNGEIFYLDPQLAFTGIPMPSNQYANFALIRVNGEQQWIPVIGGNTIQRGYRTYQGSTIELFFEIVKKQNTDQSILLTYFLEHPDNTIDQEKLIEYLLEKDETGSMRISMLHPTMLPDMLDYLKIKGKKVDLTEKSPKGKTLFMQWAGQGYPDITQRLLEQDPSIIQQVRGALPSPFLQASSQSDVKRYLQEAEILLKAMEHEKMDFTEEEQWMQRVFHNDTAFSVDAFAKLNPTFQTTLYFVAKAHGCQNIVDKLNPVLGIQKNAFFWNGLKTMARDMQAIDNTQIVKQFFDHQQIIKKSTSNNTYRERDTPLDCQTMFMENVIRELGCQHVKYPHKIIVLADNEENIQFRIKSMNVFPASNLNPPLWTIIENNIPSVARKITLDEALELAHILEKTGLQTSFKKLFKIAQENIYFTPGLLKGIRFGQPDFDQIESITEWLDPIHQDLFIKECHKRKQDYMEHERKNKKQGLEMWRIR